MGFQLKQLKKHVSSAVHIYDFHIFIFITISVKVRGEVNVRLCHATISYKFFLFAFSICFHYPLQKINCHLYCLDYEKFLIFIKIVRVGSARGRVSSCEVIFAQVAHSTNPLKMRNYSKFCLARFGRFPALITPFMFFLL